MPTVPRAVLEAEALADKLHQELINSKQPQQPGENPQPVEQTEDVDPAPPASDSQTTPQPTQQSDDWEHRFKVLQGKYNSEVPRFANENKELKSRLDELTQEVERMKAKPPEPLVRPEEIEEYGEGLVDLARRIAKEEVMQKEQEIETLKAQIRNLSETTTNTVTNDFFRSLAGLVPDWQILNEDPGFIKWLEEFDDLTGETKQSLLSKAEAARDANRVAKFFTTYKQASSSWAARSTQSLESQIVPPTNKTPDAPPAKRIWTRAEISEFYARLRRGEVSEKDAIAIDADITAASIEGRIR